MHFVWSCALYYLCMFFFHVNLKGSVFKLPEYKHVVSWEPEGHYHNSMMFCWEPEGHYCCTKFIAINPCFRIGCPKINIWGELGVQFLFIPLLYRLYTKNMDIGCPKDTRTPFWLKACLVDLNDNVLLKLSWWCIYFYTFFSYYYNFNVIGYLA